MIEQTIENPFKNKVKMKDSYPYPYSMKHDFQRSLFNTYNNSYELNILFFDET